MFGKFNCEAINDKSDTDQKIETGRAVEKKKKIKNNIYIYSQQLANGTVSSFSSPFFFFFYFSPFSALFFFFFEGKKGYFRIADEKMYEKCVLQL